MDSHDQYLKLLHDIMSKSSTIQPAVSVSRWIITVGDSDLPPAFELASRYLKIHEVALVKSHSKYAYGHSGRLSNDENEFSIPPFSTVLFFMKNRGVASSTSSLFHEPEFRLKRASHKKLIGNNYYQFEWIDDGMGKHRALKLYGSACEAMINLLRDLDQHTIDYESNDAHFELKREAVLLLVDCFNNISAYHLRGKAYAKAKEAAANVLRYDPDNRKALKRAARAAMLDPSGTYEESNLAIRALEELEPLDEETKKLRHELQRRLKDYKKREKEMYSRMVKGASKEREDDRLMFDETKLINESTDQLESHVSSKDATGTNRPSSRYIAYSLIIHVGVIALLWWLFPVLRGKYAT